MTLILSVTSYRNQALASPSVGRVESGTFSVGRGTDNDWSLPDPEVHLSKKHCLINYVGGQYTITDISTNGVFVNGATQPLGNGKTWVLRHGDHLALGDYEMLVEIKSHGSSTAESVPRANSSPRAGLEDPFRLSELLGDSWDHSVSPNSNNDGLPSAAPNVPPAIADDRWLYQASAISQSYRPQPSTEDPAAFAPLDIPDMDFLKEPEVSKRHPLISALRHAAAARTTPETTTHPAAMAEPAPQSIPPIRTSPAVPSELPPQASSADGAGWLEFISAARLEPSQFGKEDPVDLMRSLGRVFREMIVGMKELLTTRDRLKTEFRVARTVVQVTDNNPLKFAVDPAQAAALMLMRPQPGYLPGFKAVNEAFKDLKAHEIALMVGMQSAMNVLLRQFDPETLKTQFDKQRGWDGLIPGSRQSKYWAAYEEHYRQVAGEITEDARSVFGLAFAKAYEEQLKKL